MGEVAEGNRIYATIILLTYQQRHTVKKAMESLLAQECDFRFEILVADDGSSDGTREICEGYAMRYPDLIRIMPAQPNKGLVDNYFDAVQRARGLYVTDCAGDDEWIDSGRLRKQIEALDADGSLSAVFCDVVAYDSSTGVSHVKKSSLFSHGEVSEGRRFSGSDVLRRALDSVDSLPFVLSGALYRRKPIVEALERYPEVMRCHDGGVEDIPVICALGASGDVMYLPFMGYRYYVGGESLSNNLSVGKAYGFCAGVSSMVRRLGKHYGLSPSDQKDFFKAKFVYMAGLSRLSGDSSLADDLKLRVAEWDMPLPVKARLHLLLLRLRSKWGRKSEKN